MKYKIKYAVMSVVVKHTADGRKTGKYFIRSVHDSQKKAEAARETPEDFIHFFVEKDN